MFPQVDSLLLLEVLASFFYHGQSHPLSGLKGSNPHVLTLTPRNRQNNEKCLSDFGSINPCLASRHVLLETVKIMTPEASSKLHYHMDQGVEEEPAPLQ